MRLTFREFWDRVLTDRHSPIYYLILLLWLSPLGQSEFAARVPSALFGTLAISAAATLPGWSLSATARLRRRSYRRLPQGRHGMTERRALMPFSCCCRRSSLYPERVSCAFRRMKNGQARRALAILAAAGRLHALFRLSSRRSGIFHLLPDDGAAVRADRAPLPAVDEETSSRNFKDNPAVTNSDPSCRLEIWR